MMFPLNPLRNDNIDEISKFAYLSVRIYTNGIVDAAVTASIRMRLKKFRKLSGKLCANNISFLSKGDFMVTLRQNCSYDVAWC